MVPGRSGLLKGFIPLLVCLLKGILTDDGSALHFPLFKRLINVIAENCICILPETVCFRFFVNPVRPSDGASPGIFGEDNGNTRAYPGTGGTIVFAVSWINNLHTLRRFPVNAEKTEIGTLAALIAP